MNRPGDFCGGGMLLAVGVLAALPEAQRTGRGRVVDAAIVDGAALLSGMLHGFLSQGLWNDERGTNLLDAGAPFYDVYRRADDRYVAVGALERRFFDNLARELGFTDDPTFQGDHLDPSTWPAIREALKAAFARKPRDAWARPAARRRVPRCSRPVAHRNENRPPTSGRADVCGCGRRDAARACATIRRAVVRVNTNTDCKYETGSPAYAV